MLHMLAYAAMMTGQSELAIKHIRAMVAGLPEYFLKEYAPLVEGSVAMPLEVLVRFGRWDEILAEADNYPGYMPFTRAFHYATRAIARAAKGEMADARKEQPPKAKGLICDAGRGSAVPCCCLLDQEATALSQDQHIAGTWLLRHCDTQSLDKPRP